MSTSPCSCRAEGVCYDVGLPSDMADVRCVLGDVREMPLLSCQPGLGGVAECKRQQLVVGKDSELPAF